VEGKKQGGVPSQRTHLYWDLSSFNKKRCRMDLTFPWVRTIETGEGWGVEYAKQKKKKAGEKGRKCLNRKMGTLNKKRTHNVGDCNGSFTFLEKKRKKKKIGSEEVYNGRWSNSGLKGQE